jgi:Protein of unknown function (DUF3303)
MKFMTTWSSKPGALREAITQFLATGGAPAEGVTMLGRWHSIDLSVGFTLYETSDAAALYGTASPWAELLDMKIFAVIEDAEAGPLMAAAFQEQS